MNHFLEFVEAKRVESASIFGQLKCSVEEAELLQAQCRRYAAGQDEVAVLELLREKYGEKHRDYIPHLSRIKNLIDMGWLMPVSFMNTKGGRWSSHFRRSSRTLITSSIFRISLM